MCHKEVVIIPKQTFFNLPKSKQNRIFEAALREFSTETVENAKVSNIIKDANIPRGSFYQYFEDKKDLLLYVISIVGEKKVAYLGPDLLSNTDGKPFLELFRDIYQKGVEFGAENPLLVKLLDRIMASKDDYFTSMFKESGKMAVSIYKDLIDKDKKEGRIRKSIDSYTLAKLVFDMTVNVSVDEFSENDQVDFDRMYQKIDKIIMIFEKGIVTGD